ncbi:MAG: hypothetical protein RL266_2273 [Bacteroidota bacterium]|jgi:LEA14-like dessication related protein
MKQLCLFLFLTLTAAGCTQVEPLEIRSVDCCNVLKTDGKDVQIGLGLMLYNPNDFAISVKSYTLDVSINGTTIGSARSDEEYLIPSEQTVEKTISVSASAQQLLSGTLLMGITALMKNSPTTLEIEVVGSVVASAKGMSKRVRIRETYPLKLHP